MRKIIMDSKTKILIGVLVVGILLIGGWRVWNTQIENKCSSDADCRFWNSCGCASRENLLCLLFELFGPKVHWEYYPCRSCGCLNGKCTSWNAIFEEAQKTKNIELCYEIRDIACKNYCLMVLENIKTKEEVIIFTDKTEYEQEENIKVIIENNLNQNIWYYGVNGYATLYSCLNNHRYALKVQKLAKLKEDIWDDVEAHHFCCFARCYVKTPELKELKPKEKILGEWDQTVYDSEAGINGKLAEPGRNRFVFIYYLSNNTNQPNYAYSNEFIIKERSKVSEEYKIYLNSRQFIPKPGISNTLKSILVNTSSKRIHVLLQFYHIPNNDEKSKLSNLNVTLCRYVPNNAYFASIPTKYLTEVYNLSFVRWIGEILPEDKMSSIIQENRIPSKAINPDGTVNLTIMFFKDVSLDDAVQIISKHGGIVQSRVPITNDLVVIVPTEKISAIANEDSVQWIDIVPGSPIKFN